VLNMDTRTHTHQASVQLEGKIKLEVGEEGEDIIEKMIKK